MITRRSHPGPRHPVRRFHTKPGKPVHIRAAFHQDQSLHDAVFSVLGLYDLKAASLSLIGGSFLKMKFTTGNIETREDSLKQANFTYVRDWENCDLVYGAATAGQDVEGEPLLHCHAVFSDSTGNQHGGHLFPADCQIKHPVVAHICGHPHATIRQFVDMETHHTLFNPLVEGNPHVF